MQSFVQSLAAQSYATTARLRPEWLAPAVCQCIGSLLLFIFESCYPMPPGLAGWADAVPDIGSDDAAEQHLPHQCGRQLPLWILTDQGRKEAGGSW